MLAPLVQVTTGLFGSGGAVSVLPLSSARRGGAAHPQARTIAGVGQSFLALRQEKILI
jgi:hypothetical protein